MVGTKWWSVFKIKKKVTTALGVMLFWAGTHLSHGTYMDAVIVTDLLNRLQAVGVLTSHDNISEIVLQKRGRGAIVSDT